MRSMQVRATQLQDTPEAQLEVMRARSRTLRLRTSDLQAREQQLRELRMQSPPGPDRTTVDKQWLDVRHDATAATIELEGVNERIGELVRQRDEARALVRQRDQARVTTQLPQSAPEPPPVEVPGLANAGRAMAILFVAPFLIVLVYRFFTRSTVRDPLSLETSPRFQRMEQTMELIAMEVERIAEGQRFTTAILADRHPDATPRVQAPPRQEPDSITPH